MAGNLSRLEVNPRIIDITHFAVTHRGAKPSAGKLRGSGCRTHLDNCFRRRYRPEHVVWQSRRLAQVPARDKACA